MATTITEIANMAGVSRPLVSRVLNNDTSLKIKDETRQHILEVSNQLGGVKRRQSSVRKWGTILMPVNRDLLFTDNTYNSSHNYVLQVISEAIDVWKLRICVMPFDNEHKLEFFSDLCSPSMSLCQGFLLSTSIVDQPLADLLLELKFPHVCIDSRAEVYGVNTVGASVIMGYRKALVHLKDLGHTKIGYIGPLRSHYSAFLSALFETGLEQNDSFNCVYKVARYKNQPEHYRNCAFSAFTKWIKNGGKATAMICHNDFGALGALDAIQHCGLELGKDISLVGYDNIEEHGEGFDENPGLTTIDHPKKEMYLRAAELLHHQIQYGFNQVVHEHLPSELIIRDTTGPVKQGAEQSITEDELQLT